MTISSQKRQEIIDALRRGTVPGSNLDAFAVGLSRFEATLDEELHQVSTGGSVFKAVRGEYGCGKTFFPRWLAGQPNVAANAKRFAGVKGDLDHFGALNFLQGILTVLRDSGQAGLLLVLDEAETIQRVRGDVRDKNLNALPQLIDEIDSGRFPGLYVLITGTPAFFDGPQGIQRLEPLAQRLIVNSLGWRELRPFQEAVIPSILAGHHLILLAPTAGGKTEAAFFPVLSRMLSEGWTDLSVLYICPIRALLNHLDVRLQRYCSLLGRRSALWHGDIKTDARRRILRDPPDCLLTTPESLEVMLVSPSVDARRLFHKLQVVIIDEIHAFAGDDRGWHLLAVLERIVQLAGRELQRLGLSATIGNPETLVAWLAGSCTRECNVFLPPDHPGSAEVKLDYVGSLQNAAVVISRLHLGEKRLVFVDSRARAEQLAQELRQLRVTTFVTHSSLSQEQRHTAEEAFSSPDDCVIVATSVLELGIDVGSLDRVIHIDSPPTVSSFLQRMGRTGRRPGTTRNCLFLATKDEMLVQAAGLIDLWSTGYIEPIAPPANPWHILAQQLMALALQEHGIGRKDWLRWIRHVPAFSRMLMEEIDRLVRWMLQQQILWDDQGILWLGRGGEKTYGRRNFLELFSVFTSPPLFSVRHGRQELGFVDEMTLFIWLDTDGTVVILEKNREAQWWTFAGTGANATLAYELSQATKSRVTHDSFTVIFESHLSSNTIEQALSELRARDVGEMGLSVDEEAIEGLKFSECLPHDLALDMLRIRLSDPPATQWTLGRPVRLVSYPGSTH